MSRQPVISITGVSKTFRMKGARAGTLKAAMLGWLKRSPTPPYQALKDVSFEVFEGETVGIIGANGSGKSTILKLITGIIRPNGGTVSVRGRISPLIELGAGFHPEFTGRENVFLNGAMLGVPRKVLRAAYDDIVAFAEIGAFIDQPVKTYSSGMYTRLAFSIAIHVDPDILVVDEVLAVGDEAFQAKCLARVSQLREAGKTILFVAHSQKTIAAICDRVVWLDQGVKRMDGDTATVLAAYFNASNRAGESPSAVDLEALAVTDAAGRPLEVAAGGEAASLRFSWRASDETSLAWTALIRRAEDGYVVSGHHSPAVPVAPGDAGDATFEAPIPMLATGLYEIVLRPVCDGQAMPRAERRVPFRVESTWQGPGLSPWAGQWAWAGDPVKAP